MEICEEVAPEQRRDGRTPDRLAPHELRISDEPALPCEIAKKLTLLVRIWSAVELLRQPAPEKVAKRPTRVRGATVEEQQQICETGAISTKRRNHLPGDTAVKQEHYEVGLVVSSGENLLNSIEGEARDWLAFVLSGVGRLGLKNPAPSPIVPERCQLEVLQVGEVVVRPHRLDTGRCDGAAGLHHPIDKKVGPIRQLELADKRATSLIIKDRVRRSEHFLKELDPAGERAGQPFAFAAVDSPEDLNVIEERQTSVALNGCAPSKRRRSG